MPSLVIVLSRTSMLLNIHTVVFINYTVQKYKYRPTDPKWQKYIEHEVKKNNGQWPENCYNDHLIDKIELTTVIAMSTIGSKFDFIGIRTFYSPYQIPNGIVQDSGSLSFGGKLIITIPSVWKSICCGTRLDLISWFTSRTHDVNLWSRSVPWLVNLLLALC